MVMGRSSGALGLLGNPITMLPLPLEPGLFRTTGYPNLPILVEKAGCIQHATVVRKAGGEGSEPLQVIPGPGTALMELDLLRTKPCSTSKTVPSSSKEPGPVTAI